MLPAGLTKRYQLKRRLGEGSFAAVWQATEVATNRLVAIKLVPREFLSSEEAMGRFKHEGEVAAQVSHRAVLPVVEFGISDGTGFIVFPFIAGASLRNVINRGPLEPAAAFTIAIGLADALAELHRCGIVHRDVKPENVLLAEGNQPLLMDFGFSKSGGSAVETGCGIIVGTPAYISPEQLQEGKAGPLSDQFALGVVLFEMLTGQRPYEGSSPVEEALAHVHQAATPILSPLPSLDPQAAEVVMTMLQRDPGNRFSSSREAHRRLQVAAQRLQAAVRTARQHGSPQAARRGSGLVHSNVTRILGQKGRSGYYRALPTSRARVRESRPDRRSSALKTVRARAMVAASSGIGLWGWAGVGASIVLAALVAWFLVR